MNHKHEKEFTPKNWVNYYTKNTEKGYFFYRKENGIERFFTALIGKISFVEIVERKNSFGIIYRTLEITFETKEENLLFVVSVGFENWNGVTLAKKVLSLPKGTEIALNTYCIKEQEKRKFGISVKNENGEKVTLPKSETKQELFDVQTQVLKEIETQYQ